MIITKVLRWLGWQVWTEAELLEELTKLPQGPRPTPAPGASDIRHYETVNMDRVIERGK